MILFAGITEGEPTATTPAVIVVIVLLALIVVAGVLALAHVGRAGSSPSPLISSRDNDDEEHPMTRVVRARDLLTQPVVVTLQGDDVAGGSERRR